MICKYSDKCGGCLAPASFEEFHADCTVVRIPEGVRRRAKFKVDYGANVGFYARGTQNVVPIDSCAMLLPSINDLILPIRELMRSMTVMSDGEVGVMAVENGICIELKGMRIGPTDMARVREFALAHDILRISVDGRILLERSPPVVRFGGRDVPYPVGAFLQPSVAGEEAIVNAVRSFMPAGAKSGVDLFSGLGLFSLSFPDIRWQAYDCDKDSIRVLKYMRVKAAVKDLSKHPVKKFDGVDVVVLDPPRQGALGQTKAVAEAGVPSVIYVSCNQKTFLRDRAHLDNCGYFLSGMAAIDQFGDTGHMELVANFTRKA